MWTLPAVTCRGATGGRDGNRLTPRSVTSTLALRYTAMAKPQVIEETWTKVAHRVEAGAKLALEGRPTNWRRGFQDVEAIGQPCVKVERHAVVADGTDSSFFQWYWMVGKLLEKLLRQLGNLGEQGSLARYILKVAEDRPIENCHSADTACLRAFPSKVKLHLLIRSAWSRIERMEFPPSGIPMRYSHWFIERPRPTSRLLVRSASLWT